MRFVIAALVLIVAVPAADAAGGPCKNQCDSQYQACLNRTRTKQARKSCKSFRKACKGQCRG